MRKKDTIISRRIDYFRNVVVVRAMKLLLEPSELDRVRHRVVRRGARGGPGVRSLNAPMY